MVTYTHLYNTRQEINKSIAQDICLFPQRCRWRISSSGMLRHTAWQMFTDILESFMVTNSKKCTSSTSRNRTALRTFETLVTIYQSIRSNISQAFDSSNLLRFFFQQNHTAFSLVLFLKMNRYTIGSRSLWPCGLRRRSGAARLPGSRVRIPLRERMFVSYVCSGLCR